MMRAGIVVLGIASFATPQGIAAERGEELSVRSKAYVSAAAPDRIAHANAPFRVSFDPIPGLLQRDDALATNPRGACEAHARDLCYDHVDRRIVYRPVRQYMPSIEGLRAESVSLRRDRLVVKYSFR